MEESTDVGLSCTTRNPPLKSNSYVTKKMQINFVYFASKLKQNSHLFLYVTFDIFTVDLFLFKFDLKYPNTIHSKCNLLKL